MNINNHFKKIYFLLKAIIVQLKQWFLELPRYKQFVAIVGAIVILVIAIRILPNKSVTADVVELPKHVELAMVGDLSNKSNPVPLVGVVTSVTEATIRAESSGRLTKVYKKLGDKVSAGQTIAEFEKVLHLLKVNYPIL